MLFHFMVELERLRRVVAQHRCTHLPARLPSPTATQPTSPGAVTSGHPVCCATAQQDSAVLFIAPRVPFNSLRYPAKVPSDHTAREQRKVSCRSGTRHRARGRGTIVSCTAGDGACAVTLWYSNTYACGRHRCRIESRNACLPLRSIRHRSTAGQPRARTHARTHARTRARACIMRAHIDDRGPDRGR